MKALEKLRVILFVSISVMSIGCEDEDPVIGNPDASEINDYIAQLPQWNNKTATPAADRMVASDLDALGGSGVPYSCEVYEKNLVRSLENIVAVETNFGTVWPGALIQGNSLEGGDLKLINVARAPITINTDLAINNTSRDIENPNSVSVQQAIAEIQIESGQMPDGAQAGAGLVKLSGGGGFIF